jgi:hypothetical protein
MGPDSSDWPCSTASAPCLAAPIYIHGHGRPGDLSIGATPDGPFGEKLMTPKDGTPWHDRVAARSLLSFSWRRPVRRAASVRIPFLLVVPEADSIAPVPAALEVARKAPGAELFRSAGGHYDVYEGGATSPTCCERRSTSIATSRPQPKSCPEGCHGGTKQRHSQESQCYPARNIPHIPLDRTRVTANRGMWGKGGKISP